MLKGQVSVDTPMPVPAATVWEVFTGVEIGKLITQLLGDTIGKIEVLEGDGGVGTLVKVTLAPALAIHGPYMIEKFVKVDYENRIKETEMIEGGYKALGFDYVGIRLEVLEKDSESSIVRASVVYEVDEKLSDLTTEISIEPQEIIMATLAKYFSDKKAAAAAAKC
ncbi:hypothetical protein ACFE04_024832 [Oxalis oulophora]